MIEGLTYIGSHSKNDLQSVGLVFEPNFFTAYFYSDSASKKISGFRKYDLPLSGNHTNLKNLSPAYALSFSTEWTLVPKAIFNEADCADYLRFNTNYTEGQVEWEHLIGLNAVLIYRKNEQAESVVESIFPGLQVKHGMGALLEFCRHNHIENKGIQCFLHQSGNQYSLVIFNASGFIFANSITATHFEDVRYFVLYTLKTLEIEGKYSVTLLGEAASNIAVTEGLKKYIRNLEVTIDFNESEYANPNLETNAEHWIGIYAGLCAL